jgi:chorismate mutase
LQNNRWNEIQAKMVAEGAKKGLTEEFVVKLFKNIHQESIGHQEQVLNG